MNPMRAKGSSIATLVAAYASGVWGGLMVWAVLAQYVLSTRGHALGKLGSFHWVFLINVFPALLCAIGYGYRLVRVRAQADAPFMRWPVALLSGAVFPVTIRLARPLLDAFGYGMLPALAWCVLGSYTVALLTVASRLSSKSSAG